MKVLIIAPHPDDEVLGCGGAIAKHNKQGDRTHLCIITRAYTPEWSDKQVLVKFSDGTKRAMWVHDLHWVVQGIDDILAVNPVEWAEIPA